MNDLPKGWIEVQLGEVVGIERGSSPRPIKDFITNDDNGLNWIKIGDTQKGKKYITSTNEKITPDGAKKSRFVAKGDLILSNSMSLGRAYILEIDGYIHDGWFVLRLPEFISKDFLYYLLSSDIIQNQFKFLSVGGVVNNIRSDLVKQAKLYLPPKAEQTQIATLLDAHLTQLDQIKEKLTNILPIIKQFRQSVLVQAVSGGLTNNKQKIGWNMTVLGKVAKWSSGGTPPRKNPQYYEGDIAWIKTGDLGEKFITQTSEYITQEAINNSSAKLFPKGSVALAMYGATIGKTSILGIDATTNQACAVAIPNDDLNNEFLYYLLLSEKDNFILKGQGGAQPNISQTIIKEHPVCIPPLDEQIQITQQVEHYFAKADQLENHIKSALENINHMTQSLLLQAFIGNLTKEWRA